MSRNRKRAPAKRRRRDLDARQPAGYAGQDSDAERPRVSELQRGLGNAAFARLMKADIDNQRSPKFPFGPPRLVHHPPRPTAVPKPTGEGTVRRALADVQRFPGGDDKAADAAPRAEELIAAKYPYLAGVLDARQLKVVQRYTDWLYNNRRINERVTEYEKKAREKAVREGKTLSYQYTSDYTEGLEKAERGGKERPEELTVQIDTGKLLDLGILEEQPWNVQAEKEFREKWVMHFMSKPTVLDLRTAQKLEDVGTLFWGVGENGFALPNEGGHVTWKALMDWNPFALAYYKEVKNSPLIQAVDENLKLLDQAYKDAESAFEMELERKGEYPKSAWVAEQLGSEIDWSAAKHFLPKGKSFDDMGPIELMQFLNTLTPEQMDRIRRVLPGDKEWRKVWNHLMNVSMARAEGKYEAALMTMPLVADELERLVWKTQSYIQRTVEGASTAVAVLQTVQVGCKIALTVMGGVAGKAYGLVGIAAGSAGGAAGSEMLFEAGKQYGEGKFDPGAILWKGGKEGVVTFLTTMIGGGLASKFQKLLGLRMARFVPWEGARTFLIGRMADAASGVVESGVEVVVEGMLEGKWPESMDDLLDKVAQNVVVEVTIGGALDAITGIPSLKGKAWDALFGGGSKGEKGQFADLTDAEIDAALGVQGEAGTMVRGGAGTQTGRSLIDMDRVSRLNDEVRELVSGRGVPEAPGAGPEFQRSQAEVLLAQKVLANPNSPPQAVDEALEIIVQRSVADFRAYRAQRPPLSPEAAAEPLLHADNLRGLCGTARDVTADSIASLTIGSNSPIVVHRFQVNIAKEFGVKPAGGAKHAFTVVVPQNGPAYLIDPTFAQFADQISGRTFTSEKMLSSAESVKTARDLLSEGFMPLTPGTAHAYALGLGVPPDQAAVMANRIASGDGAMLTEVVANGKVGRPSADIPTAMDTMFFPRDPIEAGQGSIFAIDDMLKRLPEGDPARPMLASLRNRLLMIYAEQPKITPEGVGKPPGKKTR